MIIGMRKHKSSKRSLRPSVLLPVVLLAAGALAIAADDVEDATLSAGSFTIRRFDREAFSEPAAVLTLKQRQIFMVGRNVDLAYAGAPVPNEADLFLDWEEHTLAFADGETVALREPKLRVENLKFGALGDMGVNSNLFPDQNCPSVQTVCAKQLPGNVPEMKTGNFPKLPQLSRQVFHAYTDMLLHDMGDGLADGRPDFQAGPRDWRTPPLWGLGLSQIVGGSSAMLHDGRARNVIEAIFWHGGEARPAREAFRNMSKADREALVKFVEAI